MKMVKTEKGYFYKKVCFYCGKEFLGNIKRKFCSFECSIKYRSENISYNLKCKNCGKNFKGHNPRQFYCHTCKENLKTRICQKCGKVFKVNKVFEKQKFCSKACERKYNFNEHIFNKIETFEQTYWFGFLMGDGHIRYDIKRNVRELILGLSEKDYLHIIKFVKFLGFQDKNIPIKYDKKRKSYILRVASKTLVENLKENGFPIKDKTNRAYIPDFKKSFLKQGAILGLFDADGSAFVSGKVFYISLCGTKSVCETFSDFMGIEDKFIKKIKSTNIYEIKVGKQKKELIYKFYKKLYQNAPIYLERKKAVFEKFLKSK
ncbi:hypothetical protein [Persephonella sp. IF05-L8]|uniref:hypothetical protein n=1 Tax=Persephonella sp. IF05-L8 TaxID=1158338 RepID=UPI0012DCA51D